MALGTALLSRRFCRPFWKKPFGCFTSPPWKVKPTNAVIMQKRTACYCNGFACYTLWVYHFKRPKSVYMWTRLGGVMNDTGHVIRSVCRLHWITEMWCSYARTELQATTRRGECAAFYFKRLTAGDEHLQPDEEIISSVCSWRLWVSQPTSLHRSNALLIGDTQNSTAGLL